MPFHPLQEVLPGTTDRIPVLVEGVIPPVIALCIRWVRTTGNMTNGGDYPAWQNELTREDS